MKKSKEIIIKNWFVKNRVNYKIIGDVIGMWIEVYLNGETYSKETRMDLYWLAQGTKSQIEGILEKTLSDLTEALKTTLSEKFN